MVKEHIAKISKLGPSFFFKLGKKVIFTLSFRFSLAKPDYCANGGEGGSHGEGLWQNSAINIAM